MLIEPRRITAAGLFLVNFFLEEIGKVPLYAL